MNEILALMGKDLKILMRDKVGFFFAFGFPLIYCVFFGSIFGGGGDDSSNAISVVVVDEDKTAGSQQFVESLTKTTELEIQSADREEAEKLVRLGKKVAYVRIPKGFGEARERMFWGEPAKLETGLDPSRKAEAGMLQGLLFRTGFESMQEMFTNPGKMRSRIDGWLASIRDEKDMSPVARSTLQMFLPALNKFLQDMPSSAGNGQGNTATGDTTSGEGWMPLKIETVSVTRQREGPKTTYDISFPQGMIWGIMGCSAAFGISMVVERTGGTLIRLRMAPISRATILAGKAAACFSTLMVAQIALISIGMGVFHIRPDSFPLLILAFFCIAIAFVGIMMLLSVLGKTEQSAGGIGWSILVIMSMIGGGMIPQFFMPKWLQTINVISPVKWAVMAMDGAIWRGYSFQEMLTPALVLVGFGVVCFLFGCRAFRWTQEG
ncbi:MAG: ABC transporter permease [Planctomycetota bacterium]